MEFTETVSSPASAADAGPSRPRPGKSLVFILGALTVIAPFAIDMYLPALPQIGHDLGVDVGQVQLTLSVFLIGMAAGQAFMGPIVDRYGRRTPLLAGLAVFVVACIGCAQAQSMGALLAWRLVMALGSAASLVVPRAVVRDLFNQRESAKMYSMLMLILGISPIFAPMLGGWMLGVTGWRGIFWVLAGVGVACAAVVMTALPDSSPESRPKTIGLGLALKTYWSLLTDHRFLGASLVAGFMIGTIFTYLSASAFVFIELHALTPQQYALAFGFNGTGMILASQINRWLLNRYRVGQVLSAALLGSVLVGLALIVTSLTGWGGLPGVIALLFLNLSATGFIGPNIGAIAMAPFGKIAGSASALLGTIQFGVGAIAGGLVGFLHNGTALPMAVGIAGCALASWGIWHTLVRQQVMAAPPSH